MGIRVVREGGERREGLPGQASARLRGPICVRTPMLMCSGAAVPAVPAVGTW